MKFINYLSSIAGVSVYPMISFLVFFFFFLLLLVFLWRSDKDHISQMKNLPFDDTTK
jgi:cytochrome c oxidase cbb3-type subunit 3